jgi:hypothetical protein
MQHSPNGHHASQKLGARPGVEHAEIARHFEMVFRFRSRRCGDVEISNRLGPSRFTTAFRDVRRDRERGSA